MGVEVTLFNDPSGTLLGHCWLFFGVCATFFYIQIYSRIVYNRKGLLTNILTLYLFIQATQCVISIIKINHYPDSSVLSICTLYTLSGGFHVLSFSINLFCIAATSNNNSKNKNNKNHNNNTKSSNSDTILLNLANNEWIGIRSLSWKHKKLYFIYGISYSIFIILMIVELYAIAIFGVAAIYTIVLFVCCFKINKQLSIDIKKCPQLNIELNSTMISDDMDSDNNNQDNTGNGKNDIYRYVLNNTKIRSLTRYTLVTLIVAFCIFWTLVLFGDYVGCIRGISSFMLIFIGMAFMEFNEYPCIRVLFENDIKSFEMHHDMNQEVNQESASSGVGDTASADI